jgi:hypothetical protein
VSAPAPLRALEAFAQPAIEFSAWPELPALGAALRLLAGADADAEARRLSVEAVKVIAGELCEEGDIAEFPGLAGALRAAAQRAVLAGRSAAECALLFDAVGAVMFDRFFDCMGDAPAEFCALVLGWQSSAGLPLGVRLAARVAIGRAPEFLPDYFQENFAAVLRVVFGLAYGSCAAARDLTDYRFCAEFLETLAAFVSGADCLEAVVDGATELAALPNPAGLQTALFVIACVVEKYAEFAEDLIGPITELALRGLGCGDEFIVAVANDLVSELASWAAPCVSALFDTFLIGL